MQATTVLNMAMGNLWKVMLVQLDDPRSEKPYVLLRFGFGKPVPLEDRFELKTAGIESFREVVMDLLDDAFKNKVIQADSLDMARNSVELAIQQNTQIMH